VTLKVQGRDPIIFKNGLRYHGAPVGNGMRSIDWSRDRLRHLTQIGQNRDLVIFTSKLVRGGW